MERDSTPASASAPASPPPAVRLAVVGTGMIADLHMMAIAGESRAEISHLVDLDPQRARGASYRHGGAPWTSRLEEALEACDAVLVCTPNASHSPIAQQCLAAGRHVLVEKPMALTLQQARDMRATAREHGVVLAPAHTHRAYDYSRAVRAAIQAGDVGTPELIRLAFLGGWQWGDWRAWVLDPAQSGGHVFHNGVHLLDTVTWWRGRPPVQIEARGARLTSSHLRIDDYLEMTVRFDDGSVAVTEMSRGHRPARVGARDALVIGDSGVLSLPDGSDVSAVVDEAGPSVVTALASDAFARQLDAFVSACQGQGAPLADADDGVLSIAMAEAAQRSIESGRAEDVAAPALQEHSA